MSKNKLEETKHFIDEWKLHDKRSAVHYGKFIEVPCKNGKKTIVGTPRWMTCDPDKYYITSPIENYNYDENNKLISITTDSGHKYFLGEPFSDKNDKEISGIKGEDISPNENKNKETTEDEKENKDDASVEKDKDTATDEKAPEDKYVMEFVINDDDVEEEEEKEDEEGDKDGDKDNKK